MTKGQKIQRGSRLNTGLYAEAIVLEKKYVPSGYIVLCLALKHREYVSWFMNHACETYAGEYSNNLKGALEAYEERS